MRLFIATSFPEAVLREVNERVARIRSRLPAASWVKPEAQHVTFAFLGEQPQSVVPQLTAALSDALRDVQAFDATLRAAGFFPNPRHARVGWVGLDPEAPFTRVADIVRRAVTNEGMTLDGGDFKAHLTLMRIRDRWPPASIELFTRSLHDYRSEPFRVERITLYSSQLHPNGAIHTPLHEIALTA
ncbi:MAG TPA: RNA 2',3'-cyclic phosphodiesterase [Thermoanaerobaculia bacterium]|nr:RNA 2',3'-cyclic phosphodiesterase [Thermoanaerobaculia bacterium]